MSFFFFSSRRRHTRWPRDWSSDVCSSDLEKSGGKTRKTADLKQGVAYLFRHPVFRPLVLASAAQNMVFTGYFSIFILWVEIGRASCRERVWMLVVGG